MRVGIPKEIKTKEFRVGMVPSGVSELVVAGHEVLVETGAGEGIGMFDEDYIAVGAEIAPDASQVFERSDLIVKVKEPQLNECAMLREGQTLFTYLHLAADEPQTRALVESGCLALAYETITDAHGRLPLLQPMSEVAGRMSVQVGAMGLQKNHGGKGILLPGVPGVAPGRIVILGGGTAGENALQMAIGSRAEIRLFETSLHRLTELDRRYGEMASMEYSTKLSVEQAVLEADLVIGAVLIPGASAPRLVTREMLGQMQDGSVMVDIAIDQGGCFETSKPTTHDDPTYVVDGVVHYCVANMPGGVPRTSTFALTNATLPYILRLAGNGVRKTLATDPHFRAGANVDSGKITYEAVASAHGLEFSPYG